MILRVHRKLKIHYRRSTMFCTEGNLSSGPASDNSEKLGSVLAVLLHRVIRGLCIFLTITVSTFWIYILYFCDIHVFVSAVGLTS